MREGKTNPVPRFIYDDLKAQHAELLVALSRCRGQWIHSIHAKRCLAAIAKAEAKP